MSIFVGDLIYTRTLEDGWKESAIVIWRGRKNIIHEHFRSISFNRRPSVQPITSRINFIPIYRTLSYNCFAFFESNLKSHTRTYLFVWFHYSAAVFCVYGLNKWKKFIDTLYCNLNGELVQSTAVVWILCACCS